MSSKESTLRIGVVYPSVFGTYGDGGNATVLKRRAQMRGIAAEVVPIELGTPIPADLDIYTMGGGEDSAQTIASSHLIADRGLTQAVGRGASVLAICASLQLLGVSYTNAKGELVPGLELLDLVTLPRGERAIGELVTQPVIPGLTQPLTGFENHGGGSCLGPQASPLGEVLVGVGNGCDKPDQKLFEGAVQEGIVGTYLHGPVLARNPQLADLLIERQVGPLEPLTVPWVEELRQERLADARLVG